MKIKTVVSSLENFLTANIVLDGLVDRNQLALWHYRPESADLTCAILTPYWANMAS